MELDLKITNGNAEKERRERAFRFTGVYPRLDTGWRMIPFPPIV